MVNYSIVMRSNPMDADAAKKAYASAQYSEVMDINRFAEHIASHGCVYKRADIVAILTMAVDCMREQLLGGQKIQLGDLGDFSISINSLGAESAADYNPAIHVRKLNVNWSAGTRFQNLQEEAVFNLVATRKAARLGGEGAESRKDQCGSYRRGEGAGKRRTGLTELLYDGSKAQR